MATFLDLCRQVHRYARIGEDAPGTAPVTVQAQVGVLAEIVGWVQDAYADIQSDQDDWLFMEKDGQVTIAVTNNAASVQVDDFGSIRCYSADDCTRYILCAETGSDSWQPVYFIPWNDWAGGMYERAGALDANGMPAYFTVAPDGSFRLYPTPLKSVDLKFAYRRAPHVLMADTDSPIFPARHHVAIVWRALMYHADTRDGTSEEYKKWERRRVQAMERLYREQLPELGF